MLKIENFIDGEFKSSINEEFLDNYNPATGEKVGEISSSGPRDVEKAVKAAEDAFFGWSSLSMDERINWLE